MGSVAGMEKGQNMELWASGAHTHQAPRMLSEHSSACYFLGHEEARVSIYLPLPTCDGRMLQGLDSTVGCMHPGVRESPGAGEGSAEQKCLDCGSSQPSQGGRMEALSQVTAGEVNTPGVPILGSQGLRPHDDL